MFEEASQGNLLFPLVAILIKIVNFALDIFMWLIIIRALLSWVNPNPYNRLVRIIYRLTEPVLAPIRRFLPLHATGIDLSLMIAILAIMFVQGIILSLMKQLLFLLK